MKKIYLVITLLLYIQFLTSCSYTGNNCTKDDYILRVTDEIQSINLGDSILLKNNTGKIVIGICDKKEITYPITTGSKPKEYCSTALVKQETVSWHFNYGNEPIDDKLTNYVVDNSSLGYYFGNNEIFNNQLINKVTTNITTYWGQTFNGCVGFEIKDSSPKIMIYSRPGSDSELHLIRYKYIINNDTLTWDIKK